MSFPDSEMTNFPALVQKNVHSHDKDENKFQRIPSHLLPNSKRFLDAVGRNVHLEVLLLSMFLWFYFTAKPELEHTPRSMKTPSWGDVLQSHVEEALVSSRYPYKNVYK